MAKVFVEYESTINDIKIKQKSVVINQSEVVYTVFGGGIKFDVNGSHTTVFLSLG